MNDWRLITTWGSPPSFNMGLDEALLENLDAPPTLRFYSWAPDTLSLGYFQRYEDVAGLERAGAVVRRLTGGGAIHHVHELTFSFCCALDEPLYRGKLADSYVRVHEAIAGTLQNLGLNARLRGDSPLRSDCPDTGMCFHKSTPQDLVWENRKGVGSAQRRRNGRVLHHGSIKLKSSILDTRIATLESLKTEIDAAQLAALLLDTFRSQLGLSFEVGVPDVHERAMARELGTRYLDPAFLRRR